jgi:hypothetical protein
MKNFARYENKFKDMKQIEGYETICRRYEIFE